MKELLHEIIIWLGFYFLLCSLSVLLTLGGGGAPTFDLNAMVLCIIAAWSLEINFMHWINKGRKDGDKK